MSTILGLGNQYISTDTPLNDVDPPDSDLDLNNQKIINLANPIFTQDAATKFYVD